MARRDYSFFFFFSLDFQALRIKFDDGASFQLPSELLRVKSPSVEMIDRKGQQKIIAGRRHVGIMSVEPIGNYALRIVFDDLHESGIYTWDYLHKLGSNKLSFAKEYIRKLREKGLSRDPKTTETKKK
eukprot:TRINITY_DN9363_c0_g1_i3.p1 TRINITY_DN9363_c0_g1~~TRINITY_DN9363_c0_g1_i3.p1  ORF type:complete len:128 (+),score=24.75 TRINITY_DN9363_c0_g1_i3:121-504(+)